MIFKIFLSSDTVSIIKKPNYKINTAGLSVDPKPPGHIGVSIISHISKVTETVKGVPLDLDASQKSTLQDMPILLIRDTSHIS
jgi:hypothetical protein